MKKFLVILLVLFVAPLCVAQHSVTLTFTQSTDVVSGNEVLRGSAQGGPYTLINCTAPPYTNYVDNNVTAGQTYFYVVRAFTGTCLAFTGESKNSNEAKAVVPLSAPQNLLATPN